MSGQICFHVFPCQSSAVGHALVPYAVIHRSRVDNTHPEGGRFDNDGPYMVVTPAHGTFLVKRQNPSGQVISNAEQWPDFDKSCAPSNNGFLLKHKVAIGKAVTRARGLSQGKIESGLETQETIKEISCHHNVIVAKYNEIKTLPIKRFQHLIENDELGHGPGDFQIGYEPSLLHKDEHHSRPPSVGTRQTLLPCQKP